jgi:hypothetical protein
MNCAMWIDNPPVFDPSHGNSVLSLAYLALATPGLGARLAPEAIRLAITGGGATRALVAKHLRNVFANFPEVIAFAPVFFVKRYLLRRRIPGFFVYSRSNTYALHYHSEHAPNPESRVYLSNKVDSFGLRQLIIDLRYSALDVDTVIRSHKLLDAYIRKLGVGFLSYRHEDLAAAVLRQASDGYHQLGTTRMAASPKDGVVDVDCRVHGIGNLYVASSSVFPTSGQANPTLTVLALSVRLAMHLTSMRRADSDTAAPSFQNPNCYDSSP